MYVTIKQGAGVDPALPEFGRSITLSKTGWRGRLSPPMGNRKHKIVPLTPPKYSLESGINVVY